MAFFSSHEPITDFFWLWVATVKIYNASYSYICLLFSPPPPFLNPLGEGNLDTETRKIHAGLSSLAKAPGSTPHPPACSVPGRVGPGGFYFQGEGGAGGGGNRGIIIQETVENLYFSIKAVSVSLIIC